MHRLSRVSPVSRRDAAPAVAVFLVACFGFCFSTVLSTPAEACTQVMSPRTDFELRSEFAIRGAVEGYVSKPAPDGSGGTVYGIEVRVLESLGTPPDGETVAVFKRALGPDCSRYPAFTERSKIEKSFPVGSFVAGLGSVSASYPIARDGRSGSAPASVIWSDDSFAWAVAEEAELPRRASGAVDFEQLYARGGIGQGVRGANAHVTYGLVHFESLRALRLAAVAPEEQKAEQIENLLRGPRWKFALSRLSMDRSLEALFVSLDASPATRAAVLEALDGP